MNWILKGGGGSQLSSPDLIAQPRGEIRHLVLNTADPVFQLVAGGLYKYGHKTFYLIIFKKF
jgi:hypothetical protein